MKFRKRPVEVEATQWFKNGDHPLDYQKDIQNVDPISGAATTISAEYRKENNWEGDVVRYFRHPQISGRSYCKYCTKMYHDHGWIDTLEGGHIVCPEDWIVTGVNGERYPVKPDIFAKTYEPVEN